jgi:NAD(P)H-dependent FMN reductase
MINIQIILGSTRPGRKSEVVGNWLLDIAKGMQWDGVQFEIVDLRNYPLPFYNEPVGAGMLSEVGYTDKRAEKWAKKVAEADAYIFISPEYNHGYSAVLKNAIDYVYSQWNDKVVGFVSYGSAAGGSRAVEQLRQVAGELQMHDIREQVIIPFVWENVTDESGVLDEANHFQHGAESMLKKLIPLARLFKKYRSAKGLFPNSYSSIS